MGRFISTKFSGHQHRVIRKKPAKSILRCTAENPREKQLAKKSKKVPKEQHVNRVSEEPPPGGFEESVEEHIRAEEVEDANTEFQDLRIEVVTNPDSTKKYLKLVTPVSDLFADDDLKARYDQYTKYNFIFTIFDEIALEGLDGITIEAYWKRIQHALKLQNLTRSLKKIIWQIICLNEKIQFFELPVERGDLVINRDLGASKDASLFTDMYDTGIDIYRMEPAAKGSGQWGSCATLSTRVDISEHVREMSLDQAVYRYGNKLVFMADGDLRRTSLIDDLVDPNYEFSTMEYCLLERIGRARYMGEVSFTLSNSCNTDTKTVCHYCKRFSKEYLISKQNWFSASSTMEHSKFGRLLHLQRFYQRKKMHHTIMIESIVDYLKKCRRYRAPYAIVRERFHGNITNKFFKHQEFLKYIDTNIYVPFKEYYTAATYKEYMTKSLSRERVLQLMQLKDPYINVTACSADNQNADSSDDDDEDGGSDINRGRRVYNKDFIRDMYHHILSTGLEGVKTTELNEVFDVDFPTTRSVLKKLVFRQLIQRKKCDVGRQTVYQYVATCLLLNPDYQISQPTPVRTGTSSALEKLKEKQKQRIATLPKERIYTAEQFAVDREHQLLSLDTSQFLPVTFQIPPMIPPIVCEYLSAECKSPQSFEEINVFLIKLWQVMEPFTVQLSFPKIPDVQRRKRKLMKLLAGDSNQQLTEPKKNVEEHPGEFITVGFKPDYFSKAFLLQALLDNVQINNPAIIDFLDPYKTSRQAVKRPKEDPKDVQSDVVTKTEPGAAASCSGLGVYMGSNPTMVLTEKDEATGFLTDIYVSNPIGDYKTGVITQYVCDPSVVITERVLFRISFILKTIQQQGVFEEVNRFLRLIFQEESQTGYDKRIDRRSLHRILKKLADEGYVKIFSVSLIRGDSKKTQTYVCHPKITLRHRLIQESLAQLKDKLFCYINKAEETVPEPPKKKVAPDPIRSPFIEDDVLKSINEIKELTTKTIKSKLNKISGKYYGRRPKFARLSLLHELLFYLIYQLDKNTVPLPLAEVRQLFQSYQIKLTESDLKNLPPVFSREISWKTFIPPLPYHQSWGEGWALLIDVILRFPITLITRCYSVNFVSTELQEVLQHPIKRFYLLRNVSPNIRMMVMYRRQFIHDLYHQLVLLSYCGLTQFGPTTFHDREKSFFYLNRRATLLDTISSTPGYQKIEDKQYPKQSFHFDGIDDVLKYWSTMHNICVNTNLSSRSTMEGKTITLVDSSAKPSLNKARAVKTQDNVQEFDTGHLPGDHQGAAGLDSSMCSHLQRSWCFFATKNDPHFTVSLDMLKLDQVANNKVSYDQLKLPLVPPSKYYIAKPPDHRHTMPARKLKSIKTGKKIPVIKRTVPAIRRKSPGEKKIGADAVDKATLRKLGGLRYRPNWTDEEDKLLILLKIASAFITPGTTKQIISYSTLRDVLFIANPKIRDKTARNVANRIRVLQKSVPCLTNIENLIPNLYKLVPIAKYFIPFRKFVLHGHNPVGFQRKYKLSDPELHNAFLFLAHYFLTHRKEVEAYLHGRNICTDYFNEENLDFFKGNIEPFETKKLFYEEPQNEADIRKYVLKNTIQSALSHKHDHLAWSLQMYKIYQQFSEDVLKSVLREMRNQRMIQSKKDPARTFFTPYRLSQYYIFAQSCTFWYHTMEEAYQAFMDLKHSPSEADFSYEAMEEKKYGQMFGLNEVLSFALSDITIHLKFPEHHLILNPEVEDHSEVIEELAKRYQAKLKSDQKEADFQVELQPSGSKIDDEDIETTKSDPGPSTATAPEEPDIEVIPFDDDEPLDLSITANNSTTIDSLKHWISDCIDTERVRSPSPELLTLEVDQEQGDGDAAGEDNQLSSVKEREDRVLSLDEIKEEMLKPFESAEKRLVPYISDLTKLLSVNFEELESDERAYYLMKKHFVQRYPSLEKMTADGLNGHYLADFLENRSSISDLWESVERETHVVAPSDKEAAFDEILEKGGAIADVSLSYEMLNYIEDKNAHGAAGYELKDKFSDYASNCSLELILQVLINHHMILRTGVCSITYVHHRHQNSWLTDTFTLTQEHVSLLPNKTTSREDIQKLEADLQGVDITKWIKIKPLPWASADGTLDKDMFKMWLSNVFTYCIENPKILLTAVCDKFCYLMPVDVFYLVEKLEQIGALEMRRHFPEDVDLFSEYEYSDDCKATALDKFEDIYIEPNNVSFTALGSFFHNL